MARRLNFPLRTVAWLRVNETSKRMAQPNDDMDESNTNINFLS